MADRISIVIPVRDGARYLPAAISSLLVQRRPPDEIVVVDDGSSDSSAAIAEQFARDSGTALQVLRLAPNGPRAARNAGVAASSGDLVGFLDADDAALPQRLSSQSAALDADPTLDGVAGLASNVRDDSPAIPDALAADAPMRPFTAGTLLLRRAALERVGPFDETLASGEVVAWVTRARQL